MNGRAGRVGLVLLIGAALLWNGLAGAQSSAPAGDAGPAIDAKMRAAEQALESHDAKHAQELLTALAAERPQDAHVFYDLGYVDEDLNDNAAAQKAYTQALAVDPNYGEAHVALGLLMANTGSVAAADIEAQLRAGADNPGTPVEVRAQALRALASLELKGSSVKASDDLLKAVKLTHETEPDIVLSAELARQGGDLPDAEAAFRRALAVQPDDLSAATGLAAILKTGKQTTEADSILTAALAKHPGDVQVLSELAALKVAEGQPEQAVALLEPLLPAAPNGPEPPIAAELAHLYVLTHQEAKAEELYRRLLGDESTPGNFAGGEPKNAALLDDLGDVLVREAKFAEAEAVLRQAVAKRDGFASSSDWAEAAGHLAFASSRNHDPQTTLQALAARATVLPNSAATLFLQATAYDSLKKNKDAVRVYRAFLATANGQFPDEEFEARHRVVALEHTK